MQDNKTILVVDDDAENRAIVAQIFVKMLPHIRVLAANDGLMALDILAKKNIDIILLDWEMPKLNGLETLIKIKNMPIFFHIPVVIYTGVMTTNHNLATALELGAIDFLRKPTDPIELVARIKSILTQKENVEKRLAIEKEMAEFKQMMLKKENETLKADLQNNLLLLAQKNELLINIKNLCEKNSQPDDVQMGKKISKQIDTELNDNVYWSTFLEKINTLDSQFINRLTTQYPKLTPNEIRISALIRCNIDNKSIANLLNITTESLMTARYRMRKKMNMENEDNLEKIIFQI